jgi:hypothetical protein
MIWFILGFAAGWMTHRVMYSMSSTRYHGEDDTIYCRECGSRLDG